MDMKLIVAIVNSEDAPAVLSELTAASYSVTKLSTSGGFLRAGNVTMLIGVEKEKVKDALAIIEEFSSRRTQPVPVNSTYIGDSLISVPWRLPSAARRCLCSMWSSFTNYEFCTVSPFQRGQVFFGGTRQNTYPAANLAFGGRRGRCAPCACAGYRRGDCLSKFGQCPVRGLCGL